MHLLIFPRGHSAVDVPLLKNPITVRERVRVKGEKSGEYLCQYANDENKAFSELVLSEFGEGAFPEEGFSMKQVKLVDGDDKSWVWEHSTRGKEACCLSHVYDFVVADEDESGGQEEE